MITLITGVPGIGKTALCVSMMMAETGREFVVDGIQDLALPHSPVPPVADWTVHEADPSSQSGRKLVFNAAAFPPKCIVVIDEAQRVFRTRAATSKVPDHVAALETHRHGGIDIWLLTQHPGLLDPAVRKLVSRHIHLRSTFAGRQLLEWQECGEPESVTSRSVAARRSYTLPKDAFTRYKSAELHTKVPRRVPFYVYVFVIALLALVGTVWKVHDIISSKMAPKAASVEKGKDAVPVPGGAPRGGKPQPMTPSEYLAIRTPRVAGLAHTAPLYDAVNTAKVSPKPAGCIQMRGECRCYTHQATRLVEIDQATCESIIVVGWFDDSQENRPTRIQEARRDPPVGPGLPAAVAAPVQVDAAPAQDQPRQIVRRAPFGK